MELDIGSRLDEIRELLKRVGLADGLTQVYARRMVRVAKLATADAATREQWKPVLQFQHAQLLAVKPQIAAITKQLAPLVLQGPGLDGRKRGQRSSLERRLGQLVEAADVSDLRDQSTALVVELETDDRETRLDHLDAAQRQGDADVRDARSLKPDDPGSMTRPDTDEKRDDVASRRREAISGQGEGASPTSQQRAIVTAGEYALRARISSARVRLATLHEMAIEVYGDPEKMRKVLPNVKAFPDLIVTVNRYLVEVERTWQAAFVAANSDGAKPGDDPDEWLWQAKATALSAAQESFSNIALDRGIADFIQAASKNIQDRRLHNALVQFAATLLMTALTVGGGVLAAELGTAARVAIAAEGATLLTRGLAVAADIAINVSINSAMQFAMAGGETSVGWMLLENLLMDMFTRGLLAPLHRADANARALAGKYAQLKHLSTAEKNALLNLHIDARNMIGEMVGGVATQWAARRLLALIPGSAQHDEQGVSESFAMTVVQQGAAIGLGKYFANKRHAWKTTSDLLAKSRLGNKPELHGYVAARDEFFELAQQLANHPSPDPAAEAHLLALHESLTLQEQTLFAAHGNEHDGAPADAPAETREGSVRAGDEGPTESQSPSSKRAEPDAGPALPPGVGEIAHKGILFATSVGSAAYVGGGFFRVDTPSGHVLVEVIRTSGTEPRVRRKGEHATLEVPRGLSELELERVVVGKLTELQQQELRRANGEKATAESALGASGTGERLSPEDMGRVAELRVLKERAADQDARGPAGQEQAAAIRAEIGRLEERLGLAGDSAEAQRRRHAVDVQQVVLTDATRRARVAAELDGSRGHPGIELHNHFNGVVHAEVFRQRAATAVGGKDSGSWVPLIERIAKFKGKDFRHQEEGGKIVRRATAGDAVRIATEAWQQVKVLAERAKESTTAEDRAAYQRAAEAIAEEASRVALAASPETEFNSAYEVRDQLVKETFGGPAKEGETPAAAKQRAYDDYIREAILQLAADGVGYSEQSISVKKLATVMSPERVAAAIDQLIAEGKIRPGEIDVRLLTMLHTSQFGERAPDMPPVETPQRSDSALRRDVKTSKRQEGDPGVVGRDIGGPEQLHFDERGADAFENIYYQDLAEATRTGTPRVERPHVGEGVVDPEAGKPYHTDKDRVIKDGEPAHYERSRNNIEVMLSALERVKAKGKLDPTKVIVRFGHVTHATPEQAIRMRELGVVAEINLGSNVISGAVSQTEGVNGKRAPAERLDDHSFPTLLFYDTTIVLNTDAGAVMSTSMRAEYQRARQTIEEILRSKSRLLSDECVTQLSCR